MGVAEVGRAGADVEDSHHSLRDSAQHTVGEVAEGASPNIQIHFGRQMRLVEQRG